MINTDPQQIEELLTRGVSEVIDKEKLREDLLSGRQLRVKLGIDPTSPHIHIGRSVTLLKLRDFQKLGHKVLLLVGNATGVIGDTSDKDAERPMLTHETIKDNMRAYKEQAGKILDTENDDLFEVVYNADWLNPLGYREIGEHADAFSLAEFIARDNIKRRLNAGKRVSLRELLYPLMQGYDSVALEADVELGGTDQRFNLLAGRVLQEQVGQRPQNIVMTNLILGTDGRKMSSSWGNVITVTEEARVMGDKVMNIADSQVEEYLLHCTRVSQEEVGSILALTDPREQKLHLAGALMALYHDEATAEVEVAHLRKKYITKDEVDHQEISLEDNENILDLIVRSGAASSKGDARRKVEQGGVSVGGVKVGDTVLVITDAEKGVVLKVGKKFFRKLV